MSGGDPLGMVAGLRAIQRSAPKIKLRLVLVNDMDCELDNVCFAVHDSDEISAKVLEIIKRQSWTLTAGDTIRILERK